MANPFLVLGGIAISVATAAFGILQVPGWVASAQDAAATNDIAQVSAAQAAMVSERGTYANSFDELTDSSSVKVTPSGGVRLYTASNPTGQHHLIVARSASGTYFARTSDNAKIGSAASLEAAVTATGATVTGSAGARVTGRGVPLPTLADGLAAPVYTNLHGNPNAAGPNASRGFYQYDGTSTGTTAGPNVATGRVIEATWSKSGLAVSNIWSHVEVDRGDFSVMFGDRVPLNTKVTVRYRIVSSQPVTLSKMMTYERPDQTIRGRVVASSNESEVTLTPGVPVEVWATVITPGTTHDSFRVGFNITGHSTGLTIDVAEPDVYLGDHDPDRPWFSGTFAPPGMSVEWEGGANFGISHAFR